MSIKPVLIHTKIRTSSPSDLNEQLHKNICCYSSNVPFENGPEIFEKEKKTKQEKKTRIELEKSLLAARLLLLRSVS